MDKKLPKGAYGGVAGKDYVPYVTDKTRSGGNMIVLIIGILLAVIFAASTTYSGLKAGLTVAAGIPGAILGGGIISIFAKNKGLLGTNLVQGMSSAGESVASGVIFVLPAVLLIGGKISFLEGVVVGIGGVLVGISIASLVHNYLLVEEHGTLMYPESMAISETLVASDTGGESLKYMGIGFGIGGLITLVTGSVLGLANNVVSYVGDVSYKWRFELEVNPLLLGIGFIVGLEVAMLMFAGSILSNFAIGPLIGYFSDMAPDGVATWNTAGSGSELAINKMTAGDIGGAYAKYIGAGMMLYGGIFGAVKLIPVIIKSIKETLGAKTSDSESGQLQMVLLAAGIIISFGAGLLISNGNIMMGLLVTIVSLILMLMFVIVAGRLTGTIGTSNLPVSGMTIAAIVIVTLIFVTMGWKGDANNKTILMFGTLIVTAIAIAGGYLQSQKVTYIVGGNKNEMQRYYSIAAIIGVVVVIGVIIVLKDQLVYIDPVTKAPAFAMPQANLMATLTSGIMEGNLPWVMIFAGVFMAIVFQLLKLPIMTVAIGFYLPIATSSIILVGALIRVLVEKTTKDEVEKDAKIANGVSLSSGLVAGGSIIGLLGIILQVGGFITLPELSGFAASNGMAIVLLVILVVATTIPIITSKAKK